MSPAISSGLTHLDLAAFGIEASLAAFLMIEGAIALHVTPVPRHSSEITSVNVTTALFAMA